MKVKKNVPLKNFSTFKIGGRAEYFVSVRTPEKIIEAIGWAKEKKLPYWVVASGSNVVFPDEGLKGLTISLEGGRLERKGNKIVADAGISLAKVIKESINAGLKGLETLSGIPGSVGGAVVGNAGAYGHSISEVLEKVEVFNPKTGELKWLSKKQCRFAYRESVLKHKKYVVLRAVLKFKKGNARQLGKTSRDIIKVRERKYKPGIKCPGSFFKNALVRDVSKKALSKIDKSKIIEGKIPAGYLLEKAGAKGMRVGGIYIADFHGNLFVNDGRGRAKDVKKLSKILKNRVQKKFGIKLEEEIRYF